MRRAAIFAALLFVSAPASAEERPVLSFEARAGLTVMGGDRSTGGLTLGGGVRYLAPIGGGPWGLYGGAAADAVGVGDSWHWLGVLIGPELGGWRAAGPWRISAGIGAPIGQIPTCTDWDLCLRHWGVFPTGGGRVAYRAESFQVGLDIRAMYVNTLSWSGAATQIRLVGSYR
jgi:hypothetical protein